MAVVRISPDGNAVEDLNVTVKPLTIKRVRELQKIEKEATDEIEVLQYFVENCLVFQKEVEFESIDIVSLSDLINKEFRNKLIGSKK